MKLSYKNPLDIAFQRNIRHQIDAEIKKSQGFVRIKLLTGGYLSRIEWITYKYRVEECTNDEFILLREWLGGLEYGE